MSFPRAELAESLLQKKRDQKKRDQKERDQEQIELTAPTSSYQPPEIAENIDSKSLPSVTISSSRSILFKRSRKTRINAPVIPALSDKYKPAADMITSILTLCTSHPAWAMVAPFSKHGKPDGVFALQKQLSVAVGNKNTMSDAGIKKTLEDLKVAASGHQSRFSFTRHSLTDEFYSILSSFTPINDHDYLNSNDVRKIAALNTQVKAFKLKLDSLVEERNEPATSFPWRCCF